MSEDKPVKERFTTVSSQLYFGNMYRNQWCGKSIVSGNIDDLYFIDMYVATGNNRNLSISFNGGINITDINSMGQYFIHNDAVLKHYYSKSLEEFIYRRLFDKSSYVNININKVIDDYFSINERTYEKEKLLNLYIELYELKKNKFNMSSLSMLNFCYF